MNNTLDYLDIQGNHITDEGFTELIPYLKENKTLKHILIEGNKTNPTSLPLFIKMIESSAIESMDLAFSYYNYNKEMRFALLVNILKNKSPIVDLSNATLQDCDMQKVCDIMDKYGISHVKAVELGNNELEEEGLSTLFKSFGNCRSLESLYLGWNRINDKCINILVDFLKRCSTIKNLDLAGSVWVTGHMRSFVTFSKGKLTNVAVKKLSSWVIGNQTIKSINLSNHNDITDEVLPTLMEMIEKSDIEQLDFEEKSAAFLGKLDIPLITNRLRNHTLQKLDLCKMDLCDEDISIICNLIKKFNASTLDTVQ